MRSSSQEKLLRLSVQDADDGIDSVLKPRSSRLPSEYFVPEYGSVQLVARLFGLSKSRVWELIRDNEIRSFSDRKRGNIRGKRHILISSVRDRFEALSEPGNDLSQSNQ